MITDRGWTVIGWAAVMGFLILLALAGAVEL